jgi:hypothetical protein
MNKLPLKLAMVVTVGSLLYSTPAATQVSPTTNKAARVRITQGPELKWLIPILRLSGGQATILGARLSIAAWCATVRIPRN